MHKMRFEKLAVCYRLTGFDLSQLFTADKKLSLSHTVVRAGLGGMG